jgi:hypothetical protein
MRATAAAAAAAGAAAITVWWGNRRLVVALLLSQAAAAAAAAASGSRESVTPTPTSTGRSPAPRIWPGLPRVVRLPPPLPRPAHPVLLLRVSACLPVRALRAAVAPPSALTGAMCLFARHRLRGHHPPGGPAAEARRVSDGCPSLLRLTVGWSLDNGVRGMIDGWGPDLRQCAGFVRCLRRSSQRATAAPKTKRGAARGRGAGRGGKRKWQPRGGWGRGRGRWAARKKKR